MLTAQAVQALTARGYTEPGAQLVLQYARTGRLYCDDAIHVSAETSGDVPSYLIGECDCGISCPWCGESDSITETRITVSADAEAYVFECGECGNAWQVAICDGKAGGSQPAAVSDPAPAQELLTLAAAIALRSGTVTARIWAQAMLSSYLQRRDRP